MKQPLHINTIITYAKLNENTWSCLEQSTAFTVYKQIDFYEFCEKTTLATIKIDLPKLIEKLNLNAKVFADEMFKYGYDIFVDGQNYYLTKIGFATAKKYCPNAK